jgi:hypothetical protein
MINVGYVQLIVVEIVQLLFGIQLPGLFLDLFILIQYFSLYLDYRIKHISMLLTEQEQ